MKKAILLIGIFVALCLSSCVKTEEAVPRRFQRFDAFGGPEEWSTVVQEVPGYKKLKDIDAEKVPEVKLDYTPESSEFNVISTGNGFLIATQSFSEENEGNRNPRLVQYDDAGNVLWEKEYPFPTLSGMIGKLLKHGEDQFLLTLRTFPFQSEMEFIYEKCTVLGVDKNGELLWCKDFDDYTGERLKLVTVGEAGECYLVGEWKERGSFPTKEDVPTNIVITKLDTTGNVIIQKSFGGSDFDSVYAADYQKSIGLILVGASQSHDGDFAIPPNETRKDFIACVDENLEIQWVTFADEKAYFDGQCVTITEAGAVYAFLHENNSKGTSHFVIRFDQTGNIVWKKELKKEHWGQCITVLKNGDIAIGAGTQNDGSVVIVDATGNEKAAFSDALNPQAITATDDSGFIVTSTRMIRGVPQPLIISSIWYDTELTVVKYASDYTRIEWRKTYDRYKGEMGWDFGFPLPDGSLVISK